MDGQGKTQELLGQLGGKAVETMTVWTDAHQRTLRELALSYFHEYSNRGGHKTLRSSSAPFDMRRLPPEEWITWAKSCWKTHDRIAALRHYMLISRKQERVLTPRDKFERHASRIVQYPKPELV